MNAAARAFELLDFLQATYAAAADAGALNALRSSVRSAIPQQPQRLG